MGKYLPSYSHAVSLIGTSLYSLESAKMAQMPMRNLKTFFSINVTSFYKVSETFNIFFRNYCAVISPTSGPKTTVRYKPTKLYILKRNTKNERCTIEHPAKQKSQNLKIMFLPRNIFFDK